MFDPGVIDRKAQALARRLPDLFPDGQLPVYPIADARAFTTTLVAVHDPDTGQLTRTLTAEERRFITVERLRTPIDFRYWGERYAMINAGGEKLTPLTPFWTSQEIVIAAFARQEREHAAGLRDEGCLGTTLKARQLGVSTLTEAMLVHRITSRPYTRALLASDVTDSSAHLFGMAETMYRHLPWFLKPAATKYVTSGEHRIIVLDTEAQLQMESGKAMRGQKVEESGEGKGELGRGKTNSAVHLSELSAWENPEQIDNALFPGIPTKPYALCVLESTARGRFNWWHKQWLKSVAGDAAPCGRFAPIFIPWYAEPEKWRLRPPAHWVPLSTTLEHARRCEEQAPRWLGHRVTLSRDQLYWYESTRAGYDKDDRLAEFLTEYPAEPEDSFQFSGRSIFPLLVRERIKAQAKAPVALLAVEPAALAQERAATVHG